MEETQLKELIDTVTGDPIPLNQFSIEDKDPMVILGKLNEVEEHLTGIHDLVKSSDAKATNAVETSQDALTQIETAVTTSQQAVQDANNTLDQAKNEVATLRTKVDEIDTELDETTTKIDNTNSKLEYNKIKINAYDEQRYIINDDDTIKKTATFSSFNYSPIMRDEYELKVVQPSAVDNVVTAHNNHVAKTKENLTNVANGLNETINQVNALTPKTITFETFAECCQFILDKGREDKLINVKVNTTETSLKATLTTVKYTTTPGISETTEEAVIFSLKSNHIFTPAGHIQNNYVQLVGTCPTVSSLFLRVYATSITVAGEDFLHSKTWTGSITIKDRQFSSSTLLTADNYGTDYTISVKYYD